MLAVKMAAGSFTWSTCNVYTLMIFLSEIVVHVHGFRHTWTPNHVVTFEDLNSGSHQVFTGNKDHVDHFKVLLHDGDYILVGARNRVHNISLATLKEDEDRRLKWKPQESVQKQCEDKYQTNHCQNFIQVLGKMADGKLYVCGTNAFLPTCRIYVYKEENLPMQIPEYMSIHEEPGTGKTPYSPEHKSTAIYTDGKLYSATVADFSARDPLIMMSKNQMILRTIQHESEMLSNPKFVSSFDMNGKIYFFLRENAVENINCGKATFSRVARVCKNDHGGPYDYSSWTSFFKARLTCLYPGDTSFAFDELQSTSNFDMGYYMPTKNNQNRTKMIYGVFNTPDNSIEGSAVCAFRYDDIERTFHGKFKGQETGKHNWFGVPFDQSPTPHPASTCGNNSKSLSDGTFKFILEHPLMDSAVGSMGGAPVLMQTMSKGRFTAIAIDWQVLAVDRAYYDIMFVGTSDGRILKAINKGLDGGVESIVIEDIQVLRTDEPVKELKIFRQGVDDKLIVISKENIKSIPLHRCFRHKTCGDCVALQDPYCAWQSNECVTITSRGLQDIRNGDTSKCPDGGHRANRLPDIDVATTTEQPVATSCPVCTCNCNQSNTTVTTNTSEKSIDGALQPMPGPEDDSIDIAAQSRAEPCETKYIPVRTDGQLYTASTLATASVLSIVVAALIGFLIGYRVSMCRSHTRNTEQIINYEQQFGSLRKNPNRHSINETPHNLYADPNVQKQIKNNIEKILVSNNIPQKNPNLPNGSMESKTMSPKQASKTYL